jgi:hypothetical protein
MNVTGLVLSCLFGLLVGGILGAFIVAVVHQIRTGGIKLPPIIPLGPIKVDTSGLSAQPGDVAKASEGLNARPLIEGGGSATGGCLSLLGAAMVLVGFVLPWFTCNIPVLAIQGSVSGLTALLQLVFGVLLSLLGTAGIGAQRGGGGLAALGLVLVSVLVGAAVFLALTPLMGLQIGRSGLRLVQTLRLTNEQRRRIARSLTMAAVIGFIPLLCYMTGTMTNLSIGVKVQNLGIGVWLTLAGFVVSFLAGIVISTAAALSEQLPDHQTEQPGSGTRDAQENIGP